MIGTPIDIEQRLVKDEVIEKRFNLKGLTAYASTHRLFIKKGSTIRDIRYTHIASIEFKSRPNWTAILVGILTGVVGIYWQLFNALGWALIFTGVVLVIAGFVWKEQQIELSIVGMTLPWKLSGKRDTLDSLSQLVRGHRA